MVEQTLPLADFRHSVDGMTLAVLPPRGIITIRGDQNAPEFQNWFRSQCNADCPKVAQVVRLPQARMYWQGPDQLLLCCDDHVGTQDWMVRLSLSRPETPWVSLIETSDYFCSIQIQGRRGFDILRQGSPYDFSSLQEGQAIFTNFQHGNVLIDYAEKDHMTVMIRASFARYLWDHLVYASNQLPYFDATSDNSE